MARLADQRRTSKPSPRRVATWQRLRRWERNRKEWAGARRGALGARRLLALRERGKERRPQSIQHRLMSPRSLRVFGYSGATDPLYRLLGFVTLAATWRRCSFIGSLDELAELCGCSRRRMGQVVAHAVDLGLLEQRHHFREYTDTRGRTRHAECAASYLPGPLLWAATKDGRKCQPTSLTRRSLKGNAFKTFAITSEEGIGSADAVFETYDGASQVLKRLVPEVDALRALLTKGKAGSEPENSPGSGRVCTWTAALQAASCHEDCTLCS